VYYDLSRLVFGHDKISTFKLQKLVQQHSLYLRCGRKYDNSLSANFGESSSERIL